MAEHGRPLIGLVRTDALEDAGAVVERVREYVHLRVLPGNQLSVGPDEVRGVHVRSYRFERTARVASSVLASPPRSGVRRPPSRARSTADSIAAASCSRPSPWRSIIATEPNMASGLAIPVPAMSGAEP